MERTYKKIELIGVSEKSYEEAIQNAISKAALSIHKLDWFEVTEQRGKITDGKVSQFQIVMKVAFKLD